MAMRSRVLPLTLGANFFVKGIVHQKWFGYQHSSKNLLLCSAEKNKVLQVWDITRASRNYRPTVNYDRIFIFGLK